MSADEPTANDAATTRAIDEKYREVDADDVAENAVDFLVGDPETESEKAADATGDRS